MSLARRLNRPGWRGQLWRAAYEAGYAALRCLVLVLFRPLFLVRRDGPAAAVGGGGALVCANHTSYLDPAFLQLVVDRRITYVMTNDFYARPGARWFFTLIGAVPLGGGRLARRGLRRAAAHLRRGHVVALFPEGRLSLDGSPGPAHRGVGALIRRARVPVIPAAVRGGFRAWPRGASWLRLSDVRVRFGSPLRWEDVPAAVQAREAKEAERAFARAVMERIQALWAAMPRRPGDAPASPDSGGAERLALDRVL